MHLSPPTRTRSRTPIVLAILATASATITACSASHKSNTAGGGNASGAGGGGGGDDCALTCATQAILACPNSTQDACVAGCEFAKFEVGWCTTLVTAATDCLANEPATSFACDMNGQTAAKPGVCPSELAAMQDCWYEGPPGGLPDLTQACSTACAKQASLPCADPNCTSNCANALQPAQKCNGAFAALIACSAQQDAASFLCDTESPPRSTLKQGLCSFEGLLLLGCLQQP
jgi:hypothetical protein